MFGFIAKKIRDFAQDTSGHVTVEFLLVTPFVVWAMGASFNYIDAYRQNAVSEKAAYTVGDLVSRETEALNSDYIDTMQSLLEAMTQSDDTVRMRISVIRWDGDEERYYVEWSQTRNYLTELTDDNVGQIEHKLPLMPDDERVILVQTQTVYEPPLHFGLRDEVEMENFVFVRPRFSPQVIFDAS